MSETQGQMVLCYVTGSWAYFTSQPLGEAWGDDWNDAPYEHNAGEPYSFTPGYDDERGRAPWSVVRIAFDGDFEQPNVGTINSPYSVETINRGDVPWLRPCTWNRNPDAKPIPAGTTLPDFIALVKAGGGNVWLNDEAREWLNLAEFARR